jgi:hypothetical protein
MFSRTLHIEPLKFELFATRDDVYIVAAAKAMIDYAQQTIAVGRVINANHFAPTCESIINEPRGLVAEPIVVVAPRVARQEDV